jgi:NADPH:quinone reductase-like Zn-dependent oxidoreductase
MSAAVAEQLAENRQRQRQSKRGAKYLLQGLLVCGQCGYAYYGKLLSRSARKGHPRAHVVEVVFDANIEADAAVLAQGSSLAAYATGKPSPPVPFWPLVFKNIRVFFLGSDDFPAEAKATAARDLNAALGANWPGFETIQRFALAEIAQAHEYVESRKARGRVVVTF